jgi:hypothetical protein
VIALVSRARARTPLYRFIGAIALIASVTACKSEENLRFWGDGSGRLELHLTIESEAASTLDEARREIERRGFAILRQTADSGRTTLHATRLFSTVEELNEAPDFFRLEIERSGPFQRIFRFHHVSATLPNQLGYSRVFKVRFPVPVRTASAGTVAGQGIVWDGSRGGTLSIEASGFTLPLGHSQALLFWTALIALLLGLVVSSRLRAAPLRRCGKCRRQIDLAVRFCPSCGIANDVDEAEGGARSLRRSWAVSPVLLLAQGISLAGLGILLFLAVSVLPAELSPASSGTRGEALTRQAGVGNSEFGEKTPTAISPESFLATGAFDLATGRPKVWYARAEGGQFVLFDGPGFDPAGRLRLQPLTPQVAAEAEAWAREQAEKTRAAEEAQRLEQEHEEQERKVDRYIDRSALGVIPAHRAAVVHVIPSLDLAIDGLTRRLREAVEARGLEAIPLFRDAISRDGVDRELFAGSSWRTQQLRLSSYSTLLILVQAREIRPTVRTQHFFLTELGLEVRAIDPTTGRILRSAETSAKGAGPSEEAARTDALRNLGDTVAPAAERVLP